MSPDLSFRQRTALFEVQKSVQQGRNGLISTPNPIILTLSLSLSMQRKNLLPLPSHRLLPEAFPSLGPSLIGASKGQGPRIRGVAWKISVANSSPPGASRSARMIVTAFPCKWIFVICAQCHIVILPRICTVLECRNLCIRRGKPLKRERSAFHKFLCTSRWWAESLLGRPRHAIKVAFKFPICGRLESELSLVRIEVILIGQGCVFCIAQMDFSHRLERVFWTTAFLAHSKVLP